MTSKRQHLVTFSYISSTTAESRFYDKRHNQYGKILTQIRQQNWLVINQVSTRLPHTSLFVKTALWDWKCKDGIPVLRQGSINQHKMSSVDEHQTGMHKTYADKKADREILYKITMSLLLVFCRYCKHSINEGGFKQWSSYLFLTCHD